MLDKQAPEPGKGWGCMQCGLPADGAIVVVCDKCLQVRAPYRWVCCGYPQEDFRLPIESLAGSHEHDMSKHPGER
jgi:hypothetical protein